MIRRRVVSLNMNDNRTVIVQLLIRQVTTDKLMYISKFKIQARTREEFVIGYYQNVLSRDSNCIINLYFKLIVVVVKKISRCN